MNSSFIKRVNKEITMYAKEGFSFPNLLLQPTDTLDIWYFLIHDLKDTDYENGMYLGKIMLPPKYPFKAPDFMFLTETGRFEINKKICTTFTGFHNDQYSPSWNIASMCCGLISFMTDPPDTGDSDGIGKKNTTPEEKKEIAKMSTSKIKQNDVFKEYFENLIKSN